MQNFIQEEFIKNTQNEKIAIQVRRSVMPSAPIVILEHGLAGYKEEDMIQTAVKAFYDNGFTIIAFDARFNLGASDGALEQANFTHFIEDLQTVIEWVKTQDFCTDKIMLCGHSLGAGACLNYAIHHKMEIMGAVSMAAVVSGKLLLDSYLEHKPYFLKEWQSQKLLPRAHPTELGRKGFISYDHLDDAMRYDLIAQAHQISCPVLVVCADHDISSTQSINQLLFQSLNEPKELVVIQDSGHTFKSEQNRSELYAALHRWLQSGFEIKKSKHDFKKITFKKLKSMLISPIKTYNQR